MNVILKGHKNMPSSSKFFFVRLTIWNQSISCWYLPRKKIYRWETATTFFHEVNVRNKGLHSKSKTDSESQTKRKEKQQLSFKRGFPSRILQKRRVLCVPFIHRSLAILWCPFWTPSCLFKRSAIDEYNNLSVICPAPMDI